jgi:hypothetical protein
MGSVPDLMEDRFEEISNDGSLMMNEDYDEYVRLNSHQCSSICRVPWINVHKKSKPVAGCKSDDKKD